MFLTIFNKLTSLFGTGYPPKPNPSSDYFYDMGYIAGARSGAEWIEPPETVPDYYRKDWWAGYEVGRGRR